MENRAKTRKHWIILLLACGMAGSAMGINMNVIGVFYQPVAEDLGILTGTFAFHSTLAAFSLSFISLFIPRIIDKVDFKKMLLFGAIMASLASIGMAFTTQVWAFYLLGILRGVGSGLFGLIPYTILINNWFEEKNGLALSIVASVAGLVGVIMSPVFTWTIQSLGWETSFIIMGIFMAALSLPAVFVKYEVSPKDEGLLPYGASEEEHSASGKEGTSTGQTLTMKKISYTNISFIILMVVALLHTYSTGLVQNLPGFAVSVALGTGLGATMLSSAMAGNIFFKLGLGAVEEKIGSVNAVIVALAMTLIAAFFLIFVRNSILLVVLSFFLGAAFYIPPVGLPVLTNHFFGRQAANRIYPIVAFVAGTGGALSMSIVGFIYDFTGSYVPAFSAAVVFSVVCLFLLVFADRRKKAKATA